MLVSRSTGADFLKVLLVESRESYEVMAIFLMGPSRTCAVFVSSF